MSTINNSEPENKFLLCKQIISCYFSHLNKI